jgi:hypothetical protein
VASLDITACENHHSSMNHSFVSFSLVPSLSLSFPSSTLVLSHLRVPQLTIPWRGRPPLPPPADSPDGRSLTLAENFSSTRNFPFSSNSGGGIVACAECRRVWSTVAAEEGVYTVISEESVRLTEYD